ncbi:MAG: asparagine--tRNA ligase [Bacteroidales bacterium]|nr:asparagine--tRNA ligase [Bacteroidales bacterium]MBQ1695866.1 asparagine--tRNA ligase [Bacteroidales bacterium]MBQ1731335.1 asparagine--tRNA ligase [Bacteroidales bacterium]MBQ2075940.1 asparagine--tRNA ligase [Bacteroidales bacterium]MBQ2351238.1 asparagine--tRNA ligase [Bacteroidales bacterium]
MKRTKISEVLNSTEFGKETTVMGWVRTKRVSKNVCFIALNDGSTINNLQVVLDVNPELEQKLAGVHTGAALSVDGKTVESMGSGQKVELQAKDITVFGDANPDEYPLQPKRHSLEFLREIAHLRFRTNTFGAIFRIRHAMTFAIHNFFNSKGFYNVHTPLITGSDCEGAGEMFQVTTLDLNNLPRTEEGKIDYSQDFFGKSTNLTVSGQLEGELAATALSQIYTFGPTFRAENSNTPRHLAEFWMIEPEVAFFDLEDNMNLAEEMLKYLVKYALDNCRDDIEFLSKRREEEQKQKPANERDEMNLIERLEFVLHNDFARVTYTEAIDILMNSKPNKTGKFVYPVDKWGVDLQSEHERYLVEKHYKRPVILINYPKEIKAFYMKQNEDGKTVRAMDVLFPQIGEIIGGSQREESYEKLLATIEERNIPKKDMWWYLETRKFGTVPHSGFGLGFERLILFVTGMSNIRDVIPFPRTPKTAEF